MKNICFIVYDFSIFGGVEKVTSQLSESLLQNNCVHIISLCSKGEKTAYPLDDSISYSAVMEGTPRIRTLITGCFGFLKQYLTKHKIDIVFLMGNYPVPVGLAVKPFVPSKFVFCDHGALMNEYQKKDITMFRKYAAKFCDKVITLTQKNLIDYQKMFHIKNSKIDYIYNFIDDNLLTRSSDSYDQNSKHIVTAGRFTKEKGFNMMVDVAEMVFKKHPDWTWDVYGDGEEFSIIKEKIKDKNLENNLILKGATDHLYEQYKNYAMYVLPSYREGLPLVLLEAKANRLPIVAFDVTTGPREIVQDNQDGFLIPCYDKVLMAQKICDLIENQTLRVQFSENSQNNLSLFQKDEIINKWVALIASL